MEVRHGFAAVGAVVDDQAEAVFGEALFAGDFTRGEEQVAEDGLVFGSGFGDARDRLARNDEEVDRGPGVDVLEGDAEVVLVKDGRGDFAGDDFFEEGHRS